jgi:hypothetical protein
MRADGALVVLLAVASAAVHTAASDHPFGPEFQGAEMNRRRAVQAIAMRNISNKPDGNGRFIEGTLENRADFPVYDVRICLDSGNVCQHTSTLQAGGQATFSFRTNLLGVPDWKVTWDVVPGSGE